MLFAHSWQQARAAPNPVLHTNGNTRELFLLVRTPPATHFTPTSLEAARSVAEVVSTSHTRVTSHSPSGVSPRAAARSRSADPTMLSSAGPASCALVSTVLGEGSRWEGGGGGSQQQGCSEQLQGGGAPRSRCTQLDGSLRVQWRATSSWQHACAAACAAQHSDKELGHDSIMYARKDMREGEVPASVRPSFFSAAACSWRRKPSRSLQQAQRAQRGLVLGSRLAGRLPQFQFAPKPAPGNTTSHLRAATPLHPPSHPHARTSPSLAPNVPAAVHTWRAARLAKQCKRRLPCRRGRPAIAAGRRQQARRGGGHVTILQPPADRACTRDTCAWRGGE